MTKIIKTYEPTENTTRILSLGVELNGLIDATKSNQHRCVELATKVGALLMAEQAKVTKEMGRGYWVSYFEITFSKVISIASFYRYKKLAIICSAKNGNDELAEDYKSDIRQNDTPNLLRNGLFALEMLPKKEAPALAGDKPAPRPTSHLSLITKFKVWHIWWRKQNDYKPPTPEQATQLREDFREMIEFCKELETR